MSNNKNRYYSKGTLITNVWIIGLVGGMLASFLGIIAHFFHFMEFSPNFILTSWSNQDWVKAWQGSLVTILLFGIISIIIAFIYYALFKKMKNMIAYILFGILWWVILLFVFGPIFNDLPSVAKMSSDSIVTSICIFALYGAFIGYSISFDYQEYMHEQTEQIEETEPQPSS
ncbi:YqhR family membrane protein [Peribacillus asahii]|uniref:YqhR family membrane protein n=1 Tax=Peribacillus asahii TaxID=228899 RepID=UPI002079EAFA|nr:YqhR family membrane protein [Peribacillus asahii]USK58771.1 YqhR family membrane protein [Peribacillus asahii]